MNPVPTVATMSVAMIAVRDEITGTFFRGRMFPLIEPRDTRIQ